MSGFNGVRFNGVKLAGWFVMSAVVFGLAAPSFGRPREGRSFHDDPQTFIEENVEVLGLEEEQLTAIRSIVEASRATGDELRDELRRLHREMKELLSQDEPDASTVMQKADAIGEVETKMQKHRLGTLLEIRALLSPEQREALSGIRKDVRGDWRHALTEACDADLAKLCSDADDRWSRKQCLREHRDELSSGCREAIGAMHKAHHGHHKGQCSGE